MKRKGWIVGPFLTTSFILGCNGRLCCFVPSATSISFKTRLSRNFDLSTKRRIQEHHHHDDISARFRQDHSTAFKNHSLTRKRHECHMVKAKKPYDEDDDQAQSDKWGVLKRIRDKISTPFSSSRKDNDNANDEQNAKSRVIPTSMDAIRLRMAMAMSGLSNLGLFRFMKEEWVVACPKTRVGPGQITPCVVNGLDIIIFASRDGQRLDAFANSCPHLGSPFDLATIERKPVTEDKDKRKKDDGTGDGCVDCIVCPVHQTAFEIQSGEVRGEWCPYPPVLGGIMGFMKPKSSLVKFAVRLRGKNVEVRIATSVKNVEEGDEQAKGMRDIK